MPSSSISSASKSIYRLIGNNRFEREMARRKAMGLRVWMEEAGYDPRLIEWLVADESPQVIAYDCLNDVLT